MLPARLPACVLATASLRATVCAVLLTACGGEKDAAGAAGGPVTYRTVPVKKETLAVSIEATGTLQPASQVEVGSRVGGQVAKVLVDYNDEVKAGQLLAEIDPAPLRARRDEARGAVAGARAELERARADLALREQAAVRAADLRARGLNAPAELESANAARDVARAQVNVAQAQLNRAQASLASADSDLQATRIVAPISGWIELSSVTAGALVTAPLAPSVLRRWTVRVFGSKRVASVTSLLTVNVQVGPGAQAGRPQSAKYEPAPGVAVRVTLLPASTTRKHWFGVIALQLIPAGELVMVPLPAPLRLTCTV